MLRLPYPLANVPTLLFQQSLLRTASYFLVSVILLARLFYGIYDYDPDTVIMLTLFLLITSVAGLLLARSKRAEFLHGLLLTMQPILDVIVVSFIVHFSGGIESRLIFLYIIPALASVMVSSRYAILITMGVITSFAVVGLGEYYGLFSPVEKYGYEPQQLLVARILRVAALEIILVGGTLFYIKFLLTRGRESLALRDESLYATSQLLRQPLEDAQRFISSIREQKIETGFTPQAVEELEAEIKSSLAMSEAVLSNLESEEKGGEVQREAEISTVRP